MDGLHLFSNLCDSWEQNSMNVLVFYRKVLHPCVVCWNLLCSRPLSTAYCVLYTVIYHTLSHHQLVSNLFHSVTCLFPVQPSSKRLKNISASKLKSSYSTKISAFYILVLNK